MRYLLLATLMVPPALYCTKVLPPPSGKLSLFPSQDTLYIYISWRDLLYLNSKVTVRSITSPKTTIKQKVKDRSWWDWSFFLFPPWKSYICLVFQKLCFTLPRGNLSLYHMNFPINLPIFFLLCYSSSQTSVNLYPHDQAWQFDQSPGRCSTPMGTFSNLECKMYNEKQVRLIKHMKCILQLILQELLKCIF